MRKVSNSATKGPGAPLILTLKLILLRGIREALLQTLNLLSRGDIYQLPYDDINTIFKNHSRVSRKKGRASQDLASSSSSNTSIKSEIGNTLEDFKNEMLHTLARQMDTMQINMKQEEAKIAFVVFCLKCTRRHPRNECPLNPIEICSIYEKNHSTNKFPSLPGLKFLYQGIEGVIEQLFYINQRRPQGPRPYQQGMQGESYSYYNPNHNAFIPPWCPPAHPSWSTPSP